MQMEEEEVESRDRSSSRRWTPTSEQIKMLKEIYYDAGIRCPTVDQIGRIAARLRRFGRVEGKNVFYWFQNHKAREKHKKNISNNNNITLPLGGSGYSTECSMCCYPTSQSFFFQGTSSGLNPNYNIIPDSYSYTRNIYDETSGGRETLPLFPMHNDDDEGKVAMTPEESATTTARNASPTLELSLSPTS